MRVWESDLRLKSPAGNGLVSYSTFLGQWSTDPLKIQRVIAKCNLMNPVLIRTPESVDLFMHPVNLPGAEGEKARNKVLRDRTLLIRLYIVAILAFPLFPLYFQKFSSLFWATEVTFIVIAIYIAFDRHTVLQFRDKLEERGRYYGWLFLKSRPYVAMLAAIFIVSGICQFGFGGRNFVDQWALDYSKAMDESWRFVTGPLIHGRLAHFLTNLTMGLGVAAIAGPSMQRYFLPVFLMGGILSFLGDFAYQSLFPREAYDGLVGTSGSIAALIGCLLALCLRYRHSYPYQMWVTILTFVFVSLIAGAIFMSSVSLTCHMFGLMAGAAMSLLIPDYLADPEKKAGTG